MTRYVLCFLHEVYKTVRVFLYSVCYLFVRKDRDSIIFTSYKNMKFNFYSRVLFEYFLQEISDKKVYFVIDDDQLRKELTQRYGDFFLTTKLHNDICKILGAYIWVTSSTPVFKNPIAGINHFNVNLWHGIPYKKIALQDKHQRWFKKIIYKYYYATFFYDMFVVTSDESRKLFIDSFNINSDNVCVIGSVMADMFGRCLDSEMNSEMRTKLSMGRKHKVLYAPTYRDFGTTKYFEVSGFDADDFECFLRDNQITIYIRPHHLDTSHKQYLDIDGIESLDSALISEITFYLNQFNVLITDYSSIIFDYILTDGKLIMIPYDYTEYREKRGLNFTLDDIDCGPCVSTFDELKHYLLESVNNDVFFQSERLRFKKRFNFKCENVCSEISKVIGRI